MTRRRTVLNAGSGPGVKLPPHYDGFEIVHLDVDADNRPDIIADVRDLSALADASFDAVHLAHLLEHFPLWEVDGVLAELRRVLRSGGFVEVRVPHVEAVFRAILHGRAIDEPLYESGIGPITPLDVLYGHASTVRDGNAWMAHRTAFTPALLRAAFERANLEVELLQPTGGMEFELCGIARKLADAPTDPPSADQSALPM
jgi:SAM-dependent methyltransferase